MSSINPWSLQLCKKQEEILHQQLTDNENVTISKSKKIFSYSLKEMSLYQY